MSRRIETLIAGHGGLAREIAFYLTSDREFIESYDFIGYISDNDDDLDLAIGAGKIVMSDNYLITNEEAYAVFLGTGSPIINSKIFTKLGRCDNLTFPNFVSSACTGDWARCSIAIGNVITNGCAFTTDINVGQFNLFNLNCTVGHDAIIGDFCVFNPSCNISGSTKIGSRVLVGTGAQILQGLSICDDVIIGAGAVVTKDITEPGVYVGMPARRIK